MSEYSVGEVRLETIEDDFVAPKPKRNRHPDKVFIKGRVDLAVWVTEGIGKRKGSRTIRYQISRNWRRSGFGSKFINTFELEDFNNLGTLLNEFGQWVKDGADVGA